MLFGMCLYFLNNILPFYMIMIGATALAFGSGVYYLLAINTLESSTSKAVKNVLGITLIASSIFLGARTYEALYVRQQCTNEHSAWSTDYYQAITQARAENKKVFIKIGASFCSICKVIDKEILNDKAVQEALSGFVLVKIDGGDANNQAFAELQKTHHIIGFPTMLLIAPADGTLLHKWGSELYDKPKQEFIAELKHHV